MLIISNHWQIHPPLTPLSCQHQCPTCGFKVQKNKNKAASPSAEFHTSGPIRFYSEWFTHRAGLQYIFRNIFHASNSSVWAPLSEAWACVCVHMSDYNVSCYLYLSLLRLRWHRCKPHVTSSPDLFQNTSSWKHSADMKANWTPSHANSHLTQENTEGRRKKHI